MGVGQRRNAPGSEYAKDYGRLLRSLRIKSGLTQAEAGKVLNTSQEVVASWESGRRWPQVPDIPVLAALYRVNVADLLPDIPENVTIPSFKTNK